METTTARKMVRYIAKCKGCGIATSALGGVDNDRTWNAAGPAYSGSVFYSEMGNVCLLCRGCNRPRNARSVRGKFSKVHKCNAKCLASTGFQCECSCGGKNHGAGFEVAA